MKYVIFSIPSFGVVDWKIISVMKILETEFYLHQWGTGRLISVTAAAAAAAAPTVSVV